MTKISHNKAFIISTLFLIFNFLINVEAQVVKDTRLVVKLNEKSGAVVFHAVGRPSAIKINGKGAAPEGAFIFQENKIEGKAKFSLGSLYTTIKTRDEHMKDKYLEVIKYPEAELTLSKLDLPKDAYKNGIFSVETLPFVGQLKLHGVTKTVNGILNGTGDGHQFKMNAQFKIELADYQITIPSFAGIVVANEVSIEVQSSGDLSNEISP